MSERIRSKPAEAMHLAVDRAVEALPPGSTFCGVYFAFVYADGETGKIGIHRAELFNEALSDETQTEMLLLIKQGIGKKKVN